MSAPLADHIAKKAAKRAPMRIPKRRDPRRFQAYTVAQLLEQYRDPRAILLEIASMDTAKLAAEMHGTLADALAERRLCAQAVLPYVAQKLPVQVDLRHTRAIHLNIVDERQYQDLVEVAATETDNEESFNLQLLTGQTADEQATAQGTAQASERPVTPPQQERAIAWDIHPSNKGAQRKNVTSIEPVTPPTTTTPTGRE